MENIREARKVVLECLQYIFASTLLCSLAITLWPIVEQGGRYAPIIPLLVFVIALFYSPFLLLFPIAGMEEVGGLHRPWLLAILGLGVLGLSPVVCASLSVSLIVLWIHTIFVFGALLSIWYQHQRMFPIPSEE